MYRTAKRLLSLLLALIFCVSLFPASAMAQTPEGTIAPVTDPTPAPSDDGVIAPADPEDAGEEGGWTAPGEDPEGEAEGSIIPAPDGELQTVTASGDCGTNLTWTLTDDGTLTISGTGAMTD